MCIRDRPLCVAGAVLAVLVGPELLSLMMDSRMEDGHLFHQGDSVRVQLFLRGITDFLHNPVFGIGLISQRNSDLFTGVEGSMVFYHNSIAQIMGSMGLVGIAAYGVLMRDRIAPVSYTHLDVYKRQAHTLPKRKLVSPISRMAGRPEITRYTLMHSTKPTATMPHSRKILSLIHI